MTSANSLNDSTITIITPQLHLYNENVHHTCHKSITKRSTLKKDVGGEEKKYVWNTEILTLTVKHITMMFLLLLIVPIRHLLSYWIPWGNPRIQE